MFSLSKPLNLGIVLLLYALIIMMMMMMMMMIIIIIIIIMVFYGETSKSWIEASYKKNGQHIAIQPVGCKQPRKCYYYYYYCAAVHVKVNLKRTNSSRYCCLSVSVCLSVCLSLSVSVSFISPFRASVQS